MCDSEVCLGILQINQVLLNHCLSLATTAVGVLVHGVIQWLIIWFFSRF